MHNRHNTSNSKLFNQSINSFICFAACTDWIGYNNMRTYTLLQTHTHFNN